MISRGIRCDQAVIDGGWSLGDPTSAKFSVSCTPGKVSLLPPCVRKAWTPKPRCTTSYLGF